MILHSEYSFGGVEGGILRGTGLTFAGMQTPVCTRRPDTATTLAMVADASRVKTEFGKQGPPEFWGEKGSLFRLEHLCRFVTEKLKAWFCWTLISIQKFSLQRPRSRFGILFAYRCVRPVSCRFSTQRALHGLCRRGHASCPPKCLGVVSNL